MKQVVQDLHSGAVQVVEVPEPGARDGYVLVGVSHSLISSGTERALVDLGSKSLAQKARARPDLVRKTLDIARRDGIGEAITKARSRLDRYTELGYSLAGRVLDTGGDARLTAGAAVACVGSGYASHADVVSVPTNLVVPVPEGVSLADAAFVAPAAIALHGIRLARAAPGEVVAVIGLGLVGQLAARLLTASGCVVVGTDPRDERRAALERAGSEAEFAAIVADASRRRGADAVLVCAATPSSSPVELAGEVARDRASVVVIGDVGLELDRRVFYEKELSLVVARSYGPGRYERAYEEQGVDMPPGHVRWTEGRNVEAVLDLIGSQRLRVDDLVTHRFAVEESEQAYEVLGANGSALAILIEFKPELHRRTTVQVAERAPAGGALRIGLVGAGTFARGTLVPALKQLDDIVLAAVCARSGASARSLADRVGAPIASTDWRSLVEGSGIDAVVVATPHNTHAEMVEAALAAGKATFVEKPLATDTEGLVRVQRTPGLLLVGHNRRFAPLARRARAAVTGAVSIQIRVAAGPLAAGHWLHDHAQGGRVLGEISHFVDLATFLSGEPPSRVHAVDVDGSLLGLLQFANGSAASIMYGIGESGRLAKEHVEVLGEHAAAVIDDFRRLEIHAARREIVKGRRDKGHAEALRAFVAAARGEAPAPVSFEEQLLVAAASIALVESARTGEPFDVRLPE